MSSAALPSAVPPYAASSSVIHLIRRAADRQEARHPNVRPDVGRSDVIQSDAHADGRSRHNPHNAPIPHRRAPLPAHNATRTASSRSCGSNPRHTTANPALSNTYGNRPRHNTTKPTQRKRRGTPLHDRILGIPPFHDNRIHSPSDTHRHNAPRIPLPDTCGNGFRHNTPKRSE